MNKNLPQKYKESFFSKFINKLKSFFSRNKEENKINDIKTFKDESVVKKEMLFNLKVDIDTKVSTEYEKKLFMENLTNNPELLENFSNDRLEKILKYYLDENEKKRQLLKKLSE